MSEEPLRPDGELVPLRIELAEASGAVAPAHRFQSRVVLAGGGGSPLILTHDEAGDYGPDGAPRRALHLRAEFPREKFLALWKELAEHDVLSLSRDFVAPEQRARQGVGVHRFELALDGVVRVRFEYLASHVHTVPFFRHRAVVHALRAAADEAKKLPTATTTT